MCTCDLYVLPFSALQLTALIKPNWSALLYCCACFQARNQEGRKQGEVPLENFSLPLEKYVGHCLKVLDTYSSLKNLSHSQKTLRPPWCPKLVMGLLVCIIV